MSDVVNRALVAGHADFAAGLVSAVQQITGRGDQLVAIQVKDLHAEDIQRLLRSRMEELGSKVVFTDLQAGSCTMAVRRVQRDMPGVLLIAGANLPMLLEFVLSSNADPVQAALAAAERGRVSVTIIGAP